MTEGTPVDYGVEASEQEEYIEKGTLTGAALVLGIFSGGAATGLITETAVGLLIYKGLLRPRLTQAFRERNQLLSPNLS